MGNSFMMRLNMSQKQQLCCICSFEFNAGQEIVGLGCHPKHIVHDGCYAELAGYFKENAACPLCRVKIDESKVTRKKIEGFGDKEMDHGKDAFGEMAEADMKQNADDVNGATAEQLMYPPIAIQEHQVQNENAE